MDSPPVTLTCLQSFLFGNCSHGVCKQWAFSHRALCPSPHALCLEAWEAPGRVLSATAVSALTVRAVSQQSEGHSAACSSLLGPARAHHAAIPGLAQVSLSSDVCLRKGAGRRRAG